jgi:CheY-like chemotaxis protein
MREVTCFERIPTYRSRVEMAGEAIARSDDVVSQRVVTRRFVVSGHVIAVVEASPSLRELFREILEPEGYSVELYESGQDAAASVLLTRPSIVLLDGWLGTREEAQELYDLVTSVPCDIRVPLVVLAESVNSVAAEPSPYARATAVLGKPFDIEELLSVLKRALCPLASDASEGHVSRERGVEAQHASRSQLERSSVGSPVEVSSERAMTCLVDQAVSPSVDSRKPVDSQTAD